MIFVTVGTQLAFDRMIAVVDTWCKSNPSIDVFAQIGPSDKKFNHLRYEKFISPQQANQSFMEAELIVAHAGMGSVLTSLKYKKPIIIVPRKASLGEHRNDHQLATAKWLATRQGITVAWDENELMALLDQRNSFNLTEPIPEYATSELIENLKKYFSR